ncbi:hypothetical protein ACXYMT_09255 [Salinimicrobium sp. CAU 1759]
MKNFKISIAWLAMLALVFTSCSKEETGVINDDQELIQVTFGSLMNDFNSQNKQAEPGECSTADPAYVHVAITDSNGDYIGEDDGIDVPDVNFIPVNLKWNSAMNVWETEYTDALALEAGDYTLEYFVVFDADDNPIWVAPRSDGAYGSNVGNPLPNDFTLDPGTKPYITVDVLCYVPRNEDAYGYLFFDINTYTITNNYCLFVNYCGGDGRDYPAYFSVDVWTEGYGEGIQVIDGWSNEITMSNGWPAASVLCLPLPVLMDDDTYFVTVTVMNHDDLDYTADEMDYMEFEIDQADIDAQLNMTPRYDHRRFECGEDPGNGNGNGNGGGDDCIDDPDTGCDTVAIVDQNVSLSGVPAGQLPTIPVLWNDAVIGYVEFDWNAPNLSANFDLNEGYLITDVEIELDGVGGEPLGAPVPICIQDITENAYTVEWDLTSLDLGSAQVTEVFPIDVDLMMNVCAPQ